MFILEANKVSITVREREILTSGSRNIYFCEFRFNSDWDGVDKTAVFTAGSTSIEALLDPNGRCQIPWEVLTAADADLSVGIYGTKGETVVIPTVIAYLGRVLRGSARGNAATPPPTDVYAQILAVANNAQQLAQSLQGNTNELEDLGLFETMEDLEAALLERMRTVETGKQSLFAVTLDFEPGFGAAVISVSAVMNWADSSSQALVTIAANGGSYCKCFCDDSLQGQWYSFEEWIFHGWHCAESFAPPINDSQATRENPYSGAKIQGLADALDAAKADAIVTSEEGELVHIEDSGAYPIQGLTLYGKSSQGGTPSPENPVPVVSAGDSGSIAVTVTDGAEQCQTTALTSGLPLMGIPVVLGGTVFDGQDFQNIGNGTVSVNGTPYIADTLEVNADGTGKIVKRIQKVRLSELSFGDCGDFFNCYNLAGKYTFTALLSNAYRPENYSSIYGHAKDHEHCIALEPRGITLFITNHSAATVADLMASFTEDDYLLYASSEPETIDLTAEEVRSVLALKTYKPVTNIDNDAGAHMAVSYVADPKAYIDRKFAQLAAAQAQTP